MRSDDLAAAVERLRLKADNAEKRMCLTIGVRVDCLRVVLAALDNPATLPGVQSLVDAAAADMRERCAAVADDHDFDPGVVSVPCMIAADIRALPLRRPALTKETP